MSECCSCGRELTKAEVEYYGYHCEACETSEFKAFCEVREKERSQADFALWCKLRDTIEAWEVRCSGLLDAIEENKQDCRALHALLKKRAEDLIRMERLNGELEDRIAGGSDV